MEIDKKIKSDIDFLLGLQMHKVEKTNNGGWDINLFKSSFVNKIKALDRMGQQKSINAILNYFETKNKELNLPPVFTENHNIWQYRKKETSEEEIEDNNFNYMMLSRLKQDCEYFLGNGNRYEKNLWAGNVKDQISEMKRIWNILPKDEKPEWLSMEDIENYEKRMTSKPIEEKKYELGYGQKGSGTTVWNKLDFDKDSNDYKTIAHISNEGEVTLYDKNLPKSVIDEIKQHSIGLEITKEEVFEPNTEDEFYDVIFSQITPHDSWYGNLIKERDIKSQIYKLIKSNGSEPSENEVEEVFQIYKRRFNKKENLITPEQVAIVQPEWDKMQEFLNEGKNVEVDKLKVVKPFFGKGQYEVVKSHLDSYNEVIDDLYSIITTMPKTYETDEIRKNDKIAYLHYFTSSSDWYIVEKDMETEQLQAFGLAILNGNIEDAELGYINIEELKRYAELDFYFDPKKISEIIEEDTVSEEKPIEILKPLTAETPLDVQLRTLTGDGYNWSDYTDEKGDTPTSGGIIVHKETGRRFKAPLKFDYFKGIENEYSNQFNLNKGIEEFLDSKDNDYIFSDQEKSFLYLYEGYGGLEKEGAKGNVLLWEYYTPQLLIKKMWGLANKYGFNQGKVLEPSVGVGRFLDFSEGSNVTAYEISPYSARICKILHPKANVNLKSFEEHFYTGNMFNPKFEKDFDLVIGNPPYGDVTGKRSVAEAKRLKVAVRKWEHYFILRGLDALKSGGLLIYVSTANLFTKGYEPLKEKIGERAELIDAYLLTNKTFKTTKINTSLIVLKKK